MSQRTMLDIVNRKPVPAPWSEGDNIPWHDPEFSERMLAEHLSQEHDLASRRLETIEKHVAWIHSEILDSRPARVLDLGCGPGLYAIRLARLGCSCVGIDFSPASIRHAREAVAAEAGLECLFEHADLRDGGFGEGFDLVMLIYGQLNVFPRARARSILDSVYAALRPGGTVLLELQNRELIQRVGESGTSWYSAESGLFSSRPHLVLQENFWDEEAAVSTNRFTVIDASSGAVQSYAMSNEAYSEDELVHALHATGFEQVRSYPSLSGAEETKGQDLSVFVARKPC